MSINLKALEEINSYIQNSKAKLLIVTKTRTEDDIKKLIDLGYRNFGENKVQEAQKKFSNINTNAKINLNLIGPLQSNKVKQALSLFDTIQSVDRIKLVDEIAKYKDSKFKTSKFFIQINIGKEPQKSGVMPEDFSKLYDYCKNKNLHISGIMCIPPFDKDPRIFFKKMSSIRDETRSNLILSMGMSSDYKIAIECDTDEIRIGSIIFS